jgi:branched-chain amino acid transport system substrate-binding protein
MFQPDTPPFMKQLRAAGVKTPVVASDAQEAPETRQAGGSAMNGVVFPTHGVLRKSNAYGKFCAAYERTTKGKCDTVFIAIGGDIVKMVEAAVRKARSIEPEKEQAALENLENVQAVTSRITYKGTGGWPKKDVPFQEIRGSELVTVKTLKLGSFFIPPA